MKASPPSPDGALEQVAEAGLELAGDRAALLGRQAVELLAQQALPEALDGLVGLVCHRLNLTRCNW